MSDLPLSVSAPNTTPWPKVSLSTRLRIILLISFPIGLIIGGLLLYLGYSTINEIYQLRTNGKNVEARIVERDADGRIKYRFRLLEGGPEYFRLQLGRDIWSEEHVATNGGNVSVRYSPANPFVNRPASIPTPTGDDIGGIIFTMLFGFLPFLLLWCYIAAKHTQAKKSFSTLYIGYTAILIIGSLGGLLAGMFASVLPATPGQGDGPLSGLRDWLIANPGAKSLIIILIVAFNGAGYRSIKRTK